MLDAEQGIEKCEIIVNVKIKLAYPSPYPSPTRGEGTHFISPPLRGGDEGEGELCQFIKVVHDSWRRMNGDGICHPEE